MKEKGILEKWNNHIVKVHSGFDVEYYDNYVGTIKVNVLNKHDLSKSEYQVEYLEAYPKVINSIPFNHTTLNQTVKVTASFSYAYYTTPESRASSTQLAAEAYTSDRLADFAATGNTDRGF